MALLRRKATPLSAYEQATLLRDNALTGFRSAHDALSQSNALLAQDAEEQRLAGAAYRDQLEAMIKDAERRQAEAKALQAINQSSIDQLAGILGK